MENKPNTPDNNSQQATFIQLPYEYINGASNEDEINLAELWLTLIKKKWLLIGLPLFFVLLVLIYYSYKPKVYEAKMIFLPPTQAMVVPFNAGELAKVSPAKIYERFSVGLLSRKNQSDFFDQFNLFEKTKVSDLNNQNKKKPDKKNVYNRFHDSISIGLFTAEEPKPLLKADKVKRRFKDNKKEKIQQITLSIKGKDPQLNSDLINGFGAYVERKIVLEQINDLTVKKDLAISILTQKIEQLRTKSNKKRLDKIKQLEEQNKIAENKIQDSIDTLRVKAKTSRLAEIKRLEEKDHLDRKIIEKQIKELKVIAKIKRLDSIEKLKEALKIANNLGIKDPSYLSLDYYKPQMKNGYQNSSGMEQASNLTSQSAALTEISKQPNALYLKGERTLSEEIKKLQNRLSDDPFISQLRSMQAKLRALQTNEKISALKNRISDDPYISELPGLAQKLSLLKRDRQLEAYKSRKDDDPFIKELRDLELKLIKLNRLSYNPDNVGSAIVSQYAFPSKKTINKISKLKVVLISSVLGFFVAIFIALLSGVVSNKRQAE